MQLQTNTDRSDSLESAFSFAFGLLLWSISATLTVGLFLSLASGSMLEKLLLVITAVGLEGSKILTWRRGGPARILSWLLIALSAFASLGAALQTVEGAKGRFFSVSVEEIKSSSSYQTTLAELSSVDMEIAGLVKRLSVLPSDYVTASERVSRSIEGLRDRRKELSLSLSAMECSAHQGAAASDMIALVASELGLPATTLLLIILLLISACIEAGALVLSLPRSPRKTAVEASTGPSSRMDRSEASAVDSQPSYERPIGPSEFLEAAKQGAKAPYLCGRDRTAKKLGIPAGQAKRIVRELTRTGKVVAVGKRLRSV